MRHIKLLGVATVAALAMFVLPSVAAASGGVEADSYPVSFRWEEEGPSHFSIPGFTPVICEEAGSVGEATGPVDDLGSIIGMSCKKEGAPSGKQLEMNGCEFEFHPGSSKSFDVGPPGCGPITNLPLSCTKSIPAQTGVPATYEATTSEEHEAILVSVSEILIEVTAFCGGGTATIEFGGSWLVTGLDLDQELVDIRRGDKLDGFFIAGEESEVEAEQPHFAAETYPNPLSGSLNAGEDVTFEFEGIKITCTAANFSTNLTAATTALPLTTSLSECAQAGGSAASITMNSCRISYNLSNSDFVPPLAYKGTIGVDCSKEGDYIKLSSNGCTDLRIGAQSPSSSSVIFRNTGSGTARYLELDTATASQISYTYESGFCVLLGKEHNDGTLTVGEVTLSGI
ncbi:MAG TPA: hypothetical protein VFT19_04820 [Solirubrobacterales bacterium]|nr:hypothetical protein [Solirubrobacterales bacterium]